MQNKNFWLFITVAVIVIAGMAYWLLTDAPAENNGANNDNQQTEVDTFASDGTVTAVEGRNLTLTVRMPKTSRNGSVSFEDASKTVVVPEGAAIVAATLPNSVPGEQRALAFSDIQAGRSITVYSKQNIITNNTIEAVKIELK